MPKRRLMLRDAPYPSLPERLFQSGAELLTDVELLTLVLDGACERKGSPSSIAELVLADGRDAFVRRNFTTLANARLLGSTAAGRLAAIQEIARRLRRPDLSVRQLLDQPDRVFRYLESRAADWIEERVGVLLVDVRNRLLADRAVVRGSIESAPVSPRDVLRRVVQDDASGFLLYHNHPSGDPTPSQDDLRFTRKLASASAEMGVRFLDHVIVGREGTCSLAARGLLSPPASS